MRQLICACAAALLATPAVHAQTIYTSEAAFLAASGTVSLESFEGLAAGSAVTTLDPGPFTISSASVRVRNAPMAGMAATHGTNYVNWLAGAGSELVFTFDAPASAFGLTLTDLWDTSTNVNLDLTTDTGTPALGSGAVVFLGLITPTPFSTLTLKTHLGFADNVGVDEVYFNAAAAIPEPGTYALMLAGLVLLALARRATMTLTARRAPRR